MYNLKCAVKKISYSLLSAFLTFYILYSTTHIPVHAQIKLPGGEELPAPGGVSPELRGGLEDSGQLLTQQFLNIFFLAGATIALIMIIFSGIQWITSEGDVEKVKSARKRLIFSILGLVTIMGAFFIVRIFIFTLGGDPEKFFNPAQSIQESR